MATEPKHVRYGTPLGEWISLQPHRLLDNGSGLWNVVSAGYKGFGLEGSALTDFIRRTILVLIEAGGRPVVASETLPIWEETFQYGTKPEDITDSVIAEWLAEGASEYVEWGRWWFAEPGCHR